MASELARAAVRISTNYVRLMIMVVMGIVLVPIILDGSTDIGFGLWGLLGATAGFGDMFKEIVKTSMNRELGEAYHRHDDAYFKRVFNSALAVATGATVFGLFIYVVIYLCLPYLNIEENWMQSAKAVVIFQGIASAGAIAGAPLFNLYLASERMALYNTFLVTERASYLVSAIFWMILYPDPDPQTNLVRFAITGALMTIAVIAASSILMMILDRRTIPRPALASRDEIKQIIHTSGWNGVMSAALNMHIRLDQLLVNIWFGLAGNAVFVAAVRLASYVRMITIGMTDGLDVVAARLTSQNQAQRLNQLLPRITKLHAIIAIPAATIVVVYAPDLLRLWIGKHLDENQLKITITVVRIITVGMAARSISDGWITVLYGAGYVRKYAPIVLLGGLLNPILAYALYVLLPNNAAPGEISSSFNAAAISFSSIFIGLHLLWIPRIVRSCLQVPMGLLFVPILRPALVGALLAFLSVVYRRALPVDTALILALHAIVLAITGGLLTLLLVPDAQDRVALRRSYTSLRNRLGKRRKRA